MKARIVLVEPKYAGNLGSVARAMANFGCGELWLVKPEADPADKEAGYMAVHATGILEKAKVVDNLDAALEGVDYAVGTTARKTKPHEIKRRTLSPKAFAELHGNTGKKYALVFGNEADGLTTKDTRKCDLLLTIPAARSYSSLNLSHAVAVVLYELFSLGKKLAVKDADAKTKKLVVEQFKTVAKATGRITNLEDTVSAFKAVMNRTPLTEKECRAVLAVFGHAARQLKEKDGAKK